MRIRFRDPGPLGRTHQQAGRAGELHGVGPQRLDRGPIVVDPLRHERARQLVGEEWRRRCAASIELLLAEADSPGRPFNPKVPIARAAVRDSRWRLDTVIERLQAPAYISPQGVAMITVLLADGAGPLYGSAPSHPKMLGRALEDTLHAIDNGPVLDD
jgi:hypothetical protein